MADTPVFGIDLGTTNSCIGVWRNGDVEILSSTFKENTTPSCVAFAKNGILVGNSAVAQQNINPSNTIFEAKRTIGQKFDQIQRISKYMPFVIAQDNEGLPFYKVKHGSRHGFYPEQISAIVLKQLKEDARFCHQQEVKMVYFRLVVRSFKN